MDIGLIEEFMDSALARWVNLFYALMGREDSPYMEVNSQCIKQRYLRLTDGIFLNEVMRLIDSNPKVEQLYCSNRDDHMLRVQNFSILNRHLRAYYQEDLQQLILMPLPNIAILAQDPLTEAAVEELRRLLLLLLGCAVQCENKGMFIDQIQSLDIETQAAVASCIQEVTQNPRMVLPLQWVEHGGMEKAELELVFTVMAKQIQGLMAQRDTHVERIAALCRDRDVPAESAPHGGHSEELPQGLALQLADSRAKLRCIKQQLEDKDDQLQDYIQEVQTMEEQLKKLQKENRSLQGEVRNMRALYDELDCARERASRAEQLQTELQSCKYRLQSLELTRTRLKEQQQLCTALQETKALLEEQLADARARCSSLRELQRANLLLRQRIDDVEAERDTERQRVDELLEMNMTLEADLRHSCSIPITMAHNRFSQSEAESDEELSEMIDLKPLSVEVGEASALRLLGAEQENTELRRRLEELQTQQEADLPDAKEELACLEMEHQNTLREFQNLKNENVTLKQYLKELSRRRVLQSEERGGEGGEKRAEEEACEEQRGVIEGTVRVVEKSTETGGPCRESGVGEEICFAGGGVESHSHEVRPRERGEAEGGQKEKEKDRQTGEDGYLRGDSIKITEHWQLPPTNHGDNGPHKATLDPELHLLPGPGVELLAGQLQKAIEEADRHTLVAQDLRTKLGEQSRKAWEAEQRLMVLDAEIKRVNKVAEGLIEARRQIEVIQAETVVMEEELCSLRSREELYRMQASAMAALEGERATLERDRDTLRNTVDTLRTAQRKGDQLELSNQALRAELERQGRSLETCRWREDELEAELREATLEATVLTRGRDQALLEASQLEKQKEVCQLELEIQRKDGRQREREAARMRQQLESTALALEQGNQRSRFLDTEHRRMCQELSQSKELCDRLEDLEIELRARLESMEEEKQQLKQLHTEAQETISSLTQALFNEKAHSQELSSEVTRLNHELEKAKTELKMAQDYFNQAQQEIECLREKNGLVQSETSKGDSEVGTVPECPTETHRPQIHTKLVKTMGPLLQADTSRDIFMTPDDLAVETQWSNRERITELETEKALMLAEREVLLSRMAQSQETCTHLQDQVEALRRHSLTLQDSCTKLQTLNTQLQVEQASASSQHAAVLARCSKSEARCAALEAESKVWAQERVDSLARAEAMRRDHERLTALQQRQEVELDQLLDRHSELKAHSRSLDMQHRELQARCKELLDGQAHLEEREREVRMEREKMEGEVQWRLEREREFGRMREENERLQVQQKEWLSAQAELLAQGSVVRGELSATQLERTRLEGELSALREHTQSLDLSNVRLTSQYQLLNQLKGNMEEENRHLMEQNQALLKENRALLEQSLERRDKHHTQQREYQEKLSELRREKQKLVEKIMDQYRVLEPSMPSPASKSKKSNWIADRMKKLIKPRAGGGGGGRDGRALFTAACSVENLADAREYTTHTHTPQPDASTSNVAEDAH